VDRRRALSLLSSALAAIAARCSPPQEEIVPYVEMPERLVPGEPLRFATALSLSGYGRGAIAISIDGRPIKIEGNPRHPYSLGATDVFGEAEALSVYDPDRSQTPQKEGQIASWREFLTEWARWTETTAGNSVGMALVTGRITSPTLLRALGMCKARFPELRHYRYEPVNDDRARAGGRAAFGRRVESIPRLTEADVVVCLDADPLGSGPALLRNAREFAHRRAKTPPQRLYVIESRWTLTGTMADHRLAAAPARIAAIVAEIAAGFGLASGSRPLSEAEARFAHVVRADLVRPGARGVVLVGETQRAEIHAFAHWLNEALRGPVDLVLPSDPEEEDHGAAFSALLNDLAGGRIGTLIILDANPIYDTPDPAAIAEALTTVPFSIHCGLYADETAEHCRWHLPLSHALESWGDLRSLDGTAALQQPLIRRLYDTRAPQEVLAMLARMEDSSDRALTRETWADAASAENFEEWWRTSLHAGVVAGSAFAAVTATARRAELMALPQSDSCVLTLAPDPALWDGRPANNAWLQECPAPFTKQVWGNAVHISPEDAARLSVSTGDTLALRRRGLEIEMPAHVLQGHPEGVFAATLGHGRWRTGAVGSGIGVRVAALRDADLEWTAEAVEVRRAASRKPVRSTQLHTKLEGDDTDLFPLTAVADIQARLAQLPADKRGLVPPFPRDEYAWAMVIDNDLCIGCNACVLACQAENNVAVVGPDEIAIGRDMHWLRIDGYEIDAPSGVRRGFQPVPCMHCETAPCEPVCPVGASVHDHEGLNVQVYNRCIGTRFCEANCPYKVRRFNFFGYTRGQEFANLGQAPVLAQRNPNVSVRGRGVMEKCTYCVQRISAARRNAEKQARPIAEGEVVTACQAACPTKAIHFGNRNNADSDVAKLRSSARHYALLGHLDTRPRTTYLAKVFHANPAFEGDP
jgi:Fe-S-cluster-containing dehydrogenase component/anaerobic selenocysteine-containing dehydrogenase